MKTNDAKEEAVNKTDISPESLAKAREILKKNPSVDLHTHLEYWEGTCYWLLPSVGRTERQK
jgi:hypothetical protein